MVTVGELGLVGTIDTQDIERGHRRITEDMRRVETQAQQSEGSFSRLSSTAESLAGGLIKTGTAGVTAMMGLATQSPAVAGHLAEMRTTMRELSITAGESLEPAFETASEGLRSFTDFMRENEDSIRDTTQAISEGFVDAVEGARKVWEGFSDTSTTITKKLGMEDKEGNDLMKTFGTSATAGLLSRLVMGRRGALLTGLGTLGLQDIGQSGEGDDRGFGELAVTRGATGGGIGATAGSFFGPWGTAIGGAGGLTLGTLSAMEQETDIDVAGPMSRIMGGNPFLALARVLGLYDEETIKKGLTFGSED